MERESNLAVPYPSELVAVEAFHGDPVEPISTWGRPIQTPEEIHQRRFAGTGRSHGATNQPLSIVIVTPWKALTVSYPNLYVFVRQLV